MAMETQCKHYVLSMSVAYSSGEPTFFEHVYGIPFRKACDSFLFEDFSAIPFLEGQNKFEYHFWQYMQFGNSGVQGERNHSDFM